MTVSIESPAKPVPRTRPLEGIRVLNLSRFIAGPYIGRLLADLGADVVKVEPPEGDVTRLFGVVRNGLSGLYVQQNAGKRNLCVDLKSAGDCASSSRSPNTRTSSSRTSDRA